MWGLLSWVLWRTTQTYRDFLWRSSRLIKRSFHHRLWRLPYTKVFVCHKQRVKVSHSNLSIERFWVPFRCWVSLILTGFTSRTLFALFFICFWNHAFMRMHPSIMPSCICIFLSCFHVACLFLFGCLGFILFCFQNKNKKEEIKKYKNNVCLCTLDGHWNRVF